jgi:putative hemolysin
MKRRLMTVVASTILAVSVLAMGGSAAMAASPDFRAAERLCVAQGGEFSVVENAYFCVMSDQEELTYTEIFAAEVMCYRAYGGTLDAVTGWEGVYYTCTLPPVS